MAWCDKYSPYDRGLARWMRISLCDQHFEVIKAVDAWVVVDLRATGVVVRAFDLSLPDPEWMARKYAADRNLEAFAR